MSYGIWSPGPNDSCPAALHDSFAVTGPDGRRYPTWHPPTVTDPATGRPCTFGHEHGRDPHGSDLWPWIQQVMAHEGHAADAGIPFGYANEALSEWEAARGRPEVMRHEDHVGHKIEWANDVVLDWSTPQGRVRSDPPITCDFLVKLHQGTHSKDAFSMNLHELEYFVRCTDGTALAATVMAAIGTQGRFVRSCDKQTTVVVATPLEPVVAGTGVRFIPDRSCVDQKVLVPAGSFSDFSGGLYEDWVTANYLRTPDGGQLAYFDPHFAVFNPSRYHDPTRPGLVGRTVDACSESVDGRRARGGACDGLPAGVTWDDPRSPFNGAHRETYFNQTTLANAGGPTIWYTDPFGQRAARTPFPGSVRQFVASVRSARPAPLESQAFGADRPYDPPGSGVHAPN
jgi:hypothetical protein